MKNNGSSVEEDAKQPVRLRCLDRKRNLDEEKRIIQMLQQIHDGEGLGLTPDELDRVDLMLHRMIRAKHHMRCARPCHTCGLFWCNRCRMHKEEEEFSYTDSVCKDCDSIHAH